MSSTDSAIRAAAFEYVERLTVDGHDPISWAALQSFDYAGERIPLASQQGIFKPRRLDLPISIRTAPPREGTDPPYADAVTPDGYLLYRYRGTDPNHRENRLLRQTMEQGVHLLYLRGIAAGWYDASAAVILEADDAALTFRAVELPLLSVVVGTAAANIDEAQRRYYQRLVRQRVNQAAFRSSVLRAYRTRCAMCRLRRPELLDAAHIVPDRDGGQPVVRNGVALCKIHHAAYDTNLVGIRPDLVTEVSGAVLAESDGPMLVHGLQAVHHQPIVVPRRPDWRPSPDGIEARYEQFRRAS